MLLVRSSDNYVAFAPQLLLNELNKKLCEPLSLQSVYRHVCFSMLNIAGFYVKRLMFAYFCIYYSSQSLKGLSMRRYICTYVYVFYRTFSSTFPLSPKHY